MARCQSRDGPALGGPRRRRRSGLARRPSALGAPSLAAAGNGASPRAAGQGILASAASFRTFAFNAVQQKDGSVEGHTTLQNHTTDIRIHTRIDCLSVQGNRAVLTGYVTESTLADYPGRYTMVIVEDNGEGGSAVDRMSFQYIYGPGASFSCHDVPAALYPMVAVEKGNIQVAP